MRAQGSPPILEPCRRPLPAGDNRGARSRRARSSDNQAGLVASLARPIAAGLVIRARGVASSQTV